MRSFISSLPLLLALTLAGAATAAGHPSCRVANRASDCAADRAADWGPDRVPQHYTSDNLSDHSSNHSPDHITDRAADWGPDHAVPNAPDMPDVPNLPDVPELNVTSDARAGAYVSRYEQRKSHYIDRWNNIIPRYSKVQFAGGMGMFSAGIGWDYGRHGQWETDIMIGILPGFTEHQTIATLTLKQNYMPWRVPFRGGKFTFEPLETGLYVNKVLSRNFWGREPEKYGGSYYKFMTNTRLNIFVGQRIKMNLNEKWPRRSLSFFYEISSNDLYIISAVTNKTLSPIDYLVLSAGIKIQFL